MQTPTTPAPKEIDYSNYYFYYYCLMNAVICFI